ncbi:MAG: hypothetical protein P4L46_05410 [Fimbriimonas sp.]|nr:hypothetical protein [Fimbriimonas sp.]
MSLRVLIAVAAIALTGCCAQAFAQTTTGSSRLGSSDVADSTEPVEPGRVLRLDAPTAPVSFPSESRGAVLIWIGAGCILVAMSAFFAHRFDWQKLDGRETCPHCRAVHQTCGAIALPFDVASLTALLDLAVLPFAAALVEGKPSPERIGASALVLVAFLSLLVLLGDSLHRMTASVRSRSGPPKNHTSPMLTGVRVVGVTLSLFLLLRGVSSDSVAGQLEILLGSTIGDRLAQSVGPDAIRDTAAVLLISSALSLACRWLAPYLFASRPLILAKSSGVAPRSAHAYPK